MATFKIEGGGADFNGMDATTALFLVQDGVVNASIYALLAIALVLVFAITRVILIPQGEFVAFGALTLGALENGRVPPTVWLALGLGGLCAAATLVRNARRLDAAKAAKTLGWNLAVPGAVAAVVVWLAPLKLGAPVNILLTLATIVPLGPMLYGIVFEPLAEASVLTLLIAAFGAHIALTGLGLAFFGPEGVTTAPLVQGSVAVGDLSVSGQSLVVVGVTLALMLVLTWFFRATLTGKALRACAVNRLGARLVGMPTGRAGMLATGLAALIGAVSGVLVGPLTTIYYDTGFLIGLKGFVAAIIGGLGSYVWAALAALLVGLVESFASFFASAYKEALVFTIIIPFLLWRSLRAPHAEDEE